MITMCGIYKMTLPMVMSPIASCVTMWIVYVFNLLAIILEGGTKI